MPAEVQREQSLRAREGYSQKQRIEQQQRYVPLRPELLRRSFWTCRQLELSL